VLPEKSEDVLRRVKSHLASESVWQNTDPNCNRGGIDSFNPVVVILALPLGPAETDKVDARVLDVSLVKEFNTLETNLSPQILVY
jgi:hypothetical protein